MKTRNSFVTGARAAVIGASGGIGKAMVAQLEASRRFARVYSLVRVPKGEELRLDYDDPETIAAAAAAIGSDGPLDLVFVATGILHDGSDIRPEKSFAELDGKTLSRVFAINTIGPALVARFFLPVLRKEGRSVFAALSARVGSIGDNRLGGWLGYRASKAALNMALKTLAIEQDRRRPDCIVAALHPGTVDTALSKPYTQRLPEERLFPPDRAARQLLDVIDRLGPGDSGGFFAWDGQSVPW